MSVTLMAITNMYIALFIVFPSFYNQLLNSPRFSSHNLQLLFVRITEVFVPEHKLCNLELEPYSVRNFKIALAVFIINYIPYLKLHLGEATYDISDFLKIM